MSTERAGKIGVIGAGIGGLAAAIALRRAGFAAEVFEQAERFRRIGAAINLTPNAVKALDGLGLGEALRETAFRPLYRISRSWDTGEQSSCLEMSRAAEARYGAPQLTMHRADLLAALEGALPRGSIHLGKRLIGLQQREGGVDLAFRDGSAVRMDAVIGADGIHSAVRELLFGKEEPRFTNTVAYRSIIAAERLRQYDLSSFVKWWGPTRQSQLVTFLINRGRELFVFATRAEPDWRHESWSGSGDILELRAAFAGYHAEARDVLAACDEALKTALYERDPLPRWSEGRVTLLGDACHPMLPFMAQGAAQGLEDAVVLARCMRSATPGQIPEALARYESVRRERTGRIQLGSRENEWLKTGIDADWVYGYDAWHVGLG